MPATRAPRPTARRAPPPSTSLPNDEPAREPRPAARRKPAARPPEPVEPAPAEATGPQMNPLVPVVILAVPIVLALLANFLSAPAQ